MGLRLAGILAVAVATTVVSAQVPKPFPKPAPPTPAAPAPQQPKQPPVAPPTERAAAVPTPPKDASEPAPGSLGVAVYPAAQFITSYDAGRGQRYFLYGTSAPFADIVQFYRNTLKQRGELVFEAPPVHQFDIGRFREETMAFPPSVTVKDYTWGGSLGYLNPKRGAQPQRYPTIIQIVPNPPGAPK
jgi:hypothetical protein